MNPRTFIAGILILLILPLCFLVPTTAQAAVLSQIAETPTPEEPAGGATYTPTPTLPPPPIGGGIVAVGALAVLPEPFVGAGYIGDLSYGDSVIPLARSADGHWIAIAWEFRENRPGWIAASRVSWDPDLDLMSLPILTVPYFITSLPFTVTPPGLSPTTRAPSATPSPSEIMTATPTSSAQTPDDASEIAPAHTSGAPISTSEVTSPGLPQTGIDKPSGFLIPIIFGALVVLAYLSWMLRGINDRNRFNSGFFDGVCPICDKGDLTLEETRRSTLGVTQMKRTVRCSECRSIIRQVRPGAWRYSVDPFVNKDLADRISSETLSESELKRIFTTAALGRKLKPEEPADSDALQKAQEIVAELEARFMEEKHLEKKRLEKKQTDSTSEPAAQDSDEN